MCERPALPWWAWWHRHQDQHRSWKTVGCARRQRQICKHKRELGREPVPGRRLSRRAGWGDRQEATKQQHKQEAGPLVTGWGPARAGKSWGRRRGWWGEGGPHPRLGREVSLQGVPSENDITMEHPSCSLLYFFLKNTTEKNTNFCLLCSPQPLLGKGFSTSLFST